MNNYEKIRSLVREIRKDSVDIGIMSKLLKVKRNKIEMLKRQVEDILFRSDDEEDTWSEDDL